MNKKKQIAIGNIVLGGMLSVFALILCIYERFIQSSEGVGITAYRGYFLVVGILILIVGALRFPTKKHRAIVQSVFLLPTCLAFVMTIIIPFVLGIFYSLTDWDGVSVNSFVGFENYKEFFSAPEYIHSFFVTIVFTLINMLLVNFVAFTLSLMVTTKIKGRNIYRAGFFVPNLIGGIVLGYIWQFIFNYVFTAVGAMIENEMLSKSFLISPNLAVAAVIIVSTWQYAGYIMMIYVTAIQGVPEDVVEAAQMDGAQGITRLTKIIMPMIANAFTICLFLTLVNSFKQFDLNYAITVGGPSKMFMGKAINATEFLALNIYRTAFTKNDMSIAQAKAVVFFILLAAVSLIQVAVNKKKEVEM